MNVKTEQRMKKLNTSAPPVDLPSEFWSQGLDINQILDNLEMREKREFTIENMFQFLQKCVMKNDVELFLEETLINLDSLL